MPPTTPKIHAENLRILTTLPLCDIEFDGALLDADAETLEAAWAAAERKGDHKRSEVIAGALEQERAESKKRKKPVAPEKSAGKKLTLADLDAMPVPVIDGKVEVLPPANPGDLAGLEEQLRGLQHAVNGLVNEMVYRIVSMGLVLLKVREIHLLSSAPATVAGAQLARTADGKFEEGEGFNAWREKAFPEMSERTGQNYMNAARNAGLTCDHTPEDVERLRQNNVLQGKKPTDLYRLKDKAATSSQEGGAAVNVVADVMRDTFAHLAAALAVKESMNADEYEAMWTRIKETLEAFTGAGWEMQDTAATGEHAEISARKPRAKVKTKGEAKISTRKVKGKSAAKKGARK